MLQSFSYNNVAGEEKYSAAMNCKNVLERISNDGEGVKSEGKRAKRESERGINKRYWHVRELEHPLSNVKCETIEDFSDTCVFSDMYHYYTCPELGVRKAAVRRLACNCTACDEMITKPWTHGIIPEQQERFKDPGNCKFKSLFGNENRWHIVDLLEKNATDKEEVAASNEE